MRALHFIRWVQAFLIVKINHNSVSTADSMTSTAASDFEFDHLRVAE
jgi:hypothetical protein